MKRCFRLVESVKIDNYECLLTKTSPTKHERAVKIEKGQEETERHVLAHHTGLDLTSFEGTPFNPGVAKKVDALIGKDNRSDVSSVKFL